MKFVTDLTPEQQQTLEQVHQVSSSHRLRQRAQAVLLSAKGYSLEQLSEIFDCNRDTVSVWLTHWQVDGIGGLADGKKSGGPRKINEALEADLQELLLHPTPNLKAVIEAELEKKGIAFAGRR